MFFPQAPEWIFLASNSACRSQTLSHLARQYGARPPDFLDRMADRRRERIPDDGLPLILMLRQRIMRRGERSSVGTASCIELFSVCLTGHLRRSMQPSGHGACSRLLGGRGCGLVRVTPLHMRVSHTQRGASLMELSSTIPEGARSHAICGGCLSLSSVPALREDGHPECDWLMKRPTPHP